MERATQPPSAAAKLRVPQSRRQAARGRRDCNRRRRAHLLQSVMTPKGAVAL